MRTVCIALLLSLLACARAGASGADGDELDRFLNARGLVDAPARGVSAPAGPAPVLRTEPPSASTPHPASSNQPMDRMSEMVVAAMGALGVPYRRGGNTYDSGFDCSGFVRAVVEQTLGLMLPRNAAQQAAATHQIERTELQPGDLVFFNTLRRNYSHVGIYVGDHKFIHSPKPGAAVRIEDMRVNYWDRRFDGARRVFGQAAALTPRPATAAAPWDRPNY
jgi:cell wall-associated NlpC family hydrolase